MRLPLERKITLGFIAAAVVLFLIASLAVWNVRWLQGNFYWASRTQTVLISLEESLTDILSMQASLRGFVQTGDDQLLAPFRRGEQHLDEALATLRPLLNDSPEQQERFRQMERFAAAARDVMRNRIAAVRARGSAGMSEAPELVRGQSAVEAFRALVEKMKADERKLLENRFARTRDIARFTVATIVVGSGLAIVLVGVALVLVRRDFARRREAEAERDRFFVLSHDLLCLLSFDGYFKRLNPAWPETLGHTEQELLSRPYLDFVHPEDRARTQAYSARLAAGEDIASFENRFRSSDGTYHWLLWSARPLTDERVIVASARDITEQRESNERIRRLNLDLTARAGQLETANRELESFSYSVSHDLRAPLRHIDGFAALLGKHAEKSQAFDNEGRRYLDKISRAAKQMGALIDDLLAFSRIGRAPLRREKIDHDALVAHVIAEGRYGTPERPIAWEIGPLPAVHADLALLRQVWSNLLDNAVKYSGKVAHPKIVVGGSLDPLQDAFVFFVRDNGVGFDMTYADKLFGVFQRLHNPAEFEGTGIGLANVQRIVSRHGGRVWAEAKVEEGATFYFSLPATSPASTPSR